MLNAYVPDHMCIRPYAYDPDLNESVHEIMVLFVLRKFILQTRMRSYPVGLDVWYFVGPFV